MNPRREAFCVNIAKGMDKPDAYIVAGFKTKDRHVARVAANTLFREVTVFNRIQYLLGRKANATAQECGITRAWILEMLRENAEGALGSVTVDENTGKVIAQEGKDRAAANTALKLLGQESDGMFKDRQTIEGSLILHIQKTFAAAVAAANETVSPMPPTNPPDLGKSE